MHQQQQAQPDGSKRNSSASQASTGGSEGSRGEGPVVEADPEWAPHVDLGRQLATLHALLVDSLPKLPPARIQELDPLTDILDELSKRLVSNDIGPAPPMSDNIFRFNDPTCTTPAKTNAEATQSGQMNNFAHSSPIMNKNGVQFNVSPSKSNADESKYKGSYVSVSKSPSFNLRSQTLPRNGYGSNPVNQNVNPDRYSSQYNNQEHCVNLKVVQIGFGSDQYPKGINNGVNDTMERRFPDRYKPNNNYNQQTHFHNSNYNNSTERSPSSDNINHNYCSTDMQNLIRETATLEELSDLLKYADDADIVDDKLLLNKKNIAQSQSNNNIVNGNKTNYTHTNNGSNVSISGLSNVASSGYQSIATYSQSSSPIENSAHLHQPFENGGQPMSRYSQINYQKQRDKQYYDNKNEKFYPKSPVQQKIDYDIQKYGIQNFTTAENGQMNTNVNSKVAPLVFTNPVYNMEDNRQSPEKKCNENRNSKRCPCGSSSSSIDEEGLSTDNIETNSEEGSTNFKDDARNRNNTHRKLTRDNCNYEDVYQRSNHSHSPRTRDDESSSNSPSLRKSNSKTRMPKTNPMLSYSTNQNQLNLKHFGQRNDTLYESKPHHISTDSGYPMSRSDSNVEEVNKEMYRLQISRSQKALYNMENSKNSPEKYSLSENMIPETNYPLDRCYSGAKMSNSRLNEDVERHQEYYAARERRDKESPSRAILSRESHSSEASDRAGERSVRTDRSDLGGREKLQRRLSLESARELTDSSDEMEDTLYSTTGRRRATKHHRTIEQVTIFFTISILYL